jgi:hypothetical protein
MLDATVLWVAHTHAIEAREAIAAQPWCSDCGATPDRARRPPPRHAPSAVPQLQRSTRRPCGPAFRNVPRATPRVISNVTDFDRGSRHLPGWGVIPSIRVRDMAKALAFYTGRLEFTLDSGGGATNSSLTRGDGRFNLPPSASMDELAPARPQSQPRCPRRRSTGGGTRPGTTTRRRLTRHLPRPSSRPHGRSAVK